MNAAYKYYKELPAWAKGVTVVMGAVVAVVLGKRVYQIVDNAILKAKAKKSLKDVSNEQRKLQASGVSASFPASQYKAWADSIQNQFDGCDVSAPVGDRLSKSGTTLYEIITNFKNDMDFLELVKAFGTRTYDQCGWFTGDVENATLYTAVTDELQSGEIKTINEALAKQGITYRF